MEIQVPGQALEKAAGEVATDAGKTLIGAFRKRLDAWSAVRSAHDEAMAEEIKKDIAQTGDMKRQNTSHEERRRQELREVEHQVQVHELWLRGAQRLGEQVIDEQKRVEWVGGRAIEIANADPDRDKSRDIPDDWLKRFFKYVSEVDDEDILELLARCLADAAFPRRTILSPKALDTLRFFEHSSYEMFKFCAMTITPTEACPADFLENRAKKLNLSFGGREFDLALMIELGLVKEDRRKHFSLRLGQAFVTFSYDAGVNHEFRVFQLTYVGRSIAALIDKRLGRLETHLRALDTSSDVVSLQQSAGLDEEMARSLGRCLVSQLADTSPTDINVKSYEGRAREDIFSSTRKAISDEFDVARGLRHAFGDEYTRQLSETLAEVFDDFDKNQLPYLYPKDG